MAFFKRLFDGPKGGPGARTQGATKKHHHQHNSLPLTHPHDSDDSDDDHGPLSCPQLDVGTLRRGGLDGGSMQFSERESVRRSRTWAGREEFTGAASAAAMARLSTSSSEFSPDDKLRSSYRKVTRSHRGRNAVVLAAVDRSTGCPVAIKVFQKQTTTSFKLQKMQREVAVLRTVGSIPGVVRLQNVLEDNLCYYTILEAMPGCTLIEMMAHRGGKLTEQQCALEVAMPLLMTLAALHKLGVVHRDIKPEHVLCASGSVCLLDFVECAIKSEQNLNHRAGQLEYCAPEVLDKPPLTDVFHKVLYHGMSEEELPQYDEKADLWSVGVLLFEALTGLQPFMADDAHDMAACHRAQLTDRTPAGVPLFLANQKLGPQAQQFLAAMLQLDPAERPSAQELLEHPWLKAHSQPPPASTLRAHAPTAPPDKTMSDGFLLNTTQPSPSRLSRSHSAAVNNRNTGGGSRDVLGVVGEGVQAFC